MANYEFDGISTDGFNPEDRKGFEEFYEILTLKQLCRHNKPIVIYNINGYYDDLEKAMQSAIAKNFVKENCLELYKVTEDLEELFTYLEAPTIGSREIKELKDG